MTIGRYGKNGGKNEGVMGITGCARVMAIRVSGCGWANYGGNSIFSRSDNVRISDNSDDGTVIDIPERGESGLWQVFDGRGLN